MEKVVYVLTGSDPAHLLGPVADELLDLGARGLVNVADEAGAPAHRLGIVTSLDVLPTSRYVIGPV